MFYHIVTIFVAVIGLANPLSQSDPLAWLAKAERSPLPVQSIALKGAGLFDVPAHLTAELVGKPARQTTAIEAVLDQKATITADELIRSFGAMDIYALASTARPLNGSVKWLVKIKARDHFGRYVRILLAASNQPMKSDGDLAGLRQLDWHACPVLAVGIGQSIDKTSPVSQLLWSDRVKIGNETIDLVTTHLR